MELAAHERLARYSQFTLTQVNELVVSRGVVGVYLLKLAVTNVIDAFCVILSLAKSLPIIRDLEKGTKTWYVYSSTVWQ